MNYLMRNILHLSLLALTAYGFSDAPVAPQTEKVEPRIGKPGTIIKITGKSLGKSHVDEVYLTDHRFDLKIKILDQSDTTITVRVPPFVKPGRLQLLLLTSGSRPVYLEQPWFVQIEADEELPPPVEISQRSKPTVEVAATGTNIPVPMAGIAPSPATTPSVEKSIVPLKPVPAPEVPKAEASKAQIPKAEIPKAAETPKGEVSRFEVATVDFPKTPPTPAAPPIVVIQTLPNPANIPAQIVKRSQVPYPVRAAAQHIEGPVELIVVIRIDGRVKDVKIIKGNPFLVGTAISSVKEWIYEPAYLNGKPVESELSLTLNFRRP